MNATDPEPLRACWYCGNTVYRDRRCPVCLHKPLPAKDRRT